MIAEITSNEQSELMIVFNDKIMAPPLRSPDDSFRYFMSIWDKQTIVLQERVYVVFLNDNLNPIGWRLLNVGNSNSAIVDIKLACALAVKVMACNVIIAHNHPSGNTEPSFRDKELTKKLKTALGYLDISLIDHLIIEKFSFFSFKNNDLI
jgi:DNA repair protein RadC